MNYLFSEEKLEIEKNSLERYFPEKEEKTHEEKLLLMIKRSRHGVIPCLNKEETQKMINFFKENLGEKYSFYYEESGRSIIYKKTSLELVIN
jgi:hypothetical protein